MPGVGVVRLPRTYDVLAAVCVGKLNLPSEYVSSVLSLAGIVGEALEEFRAAKTRWNSLEVGVVVAAELLQSSFVVSQPLWGYLVL
jgi:hypothetical protein